MKNFRNGCEAIGRARGVRDHIVLRRIVPFVVNAHAERQVLAFSRSGDNDFLYGSAQVLARVVGICEQPGGLDNDGCAERRPVDLRRIFLFEHLHRLSVDDDVVLAMADVRFQSAQHGIMFKKVGECLGIRDVVHSNNVDIVVAHRGAVKIASNASKAVDAYFDCH